MEKVSFEHIENNIREWTSDNISPNFEFRPGQFESIRGIIYAIINNHVDTNILQAPTGTGKSFICIISAGVLAKYYNKKSYILASDLYLWKQYADAIDKYKLKDFGYMKGSLGNYYCNFSNCNFEDGECRKKRVPMSKFRHRDTSTINKWPCFNMCQYFLDRFRAESTPVTLLTYQLWLYQMNLVKADPGEGFSQRDVIFCDECHNIPDIISMFAQPQVTTKDRDKILQIVDYVVRHNVSLPWVPDFFNSEGQRLFRKSNESKFSEKHGPCTNYLDVPRILKTYNYFMGAIEIVFRGLEIPVKKSEIKTEVLMEYVNFLSDINKIADAASEHSKKMSGATNDSKISKDNKADAFIHQTLNWFHNYYSSLNQYIRAIYDAGQQYIVVEKTEDDNREPTYTFFCVKEDYLCKTYLLDNAKHKVMTSATVGNIMSYLTNIGIDITKVTDNQNYVLYSALPNIFDFSQSPIYFCPNYKMNFKEKNYSFPKIQELVYKILEAYPDVRGMINTGSYQNSAAIINNAPHKLKRRIIGYGSARDKNTVLNRFKSSKNAIIVGPTLVEGVDLPGDLCRLIIIIKLPYPNLKSPLTNAKMGLFPLWYDSTTSNTIIQNIGRGVRFDGDWCHTYILDGCFEYLYNKTYQQYPPEIQQRFIRITPEFILQSNQ